MRISVKLLPPYCKTGETGELILDLPDKRWNLQRLALYLNRVCPDILAFPLVEEKGCITAEFMVNGTHTPVNRVLREGDRITVFFYICGG